MGKNKNGRRSTGKNKKRETFKKYGKNTARGVRIKESEMENKDIKNKWKKQDHRPLFLSINRARLIKENTVHRLRAVYAK